MKPSGDNSLSSSFVFGKTSSHGVINNDNTFLWMTSNKIGNHSSSVKGPPEVAMVIDFEGYNISGQINLTLFGGFVANSEISIDFDLNRLENLTISHLLE